MALGSTWFDGTGTPSYQDVRCDADYTSASPSSTISGSYARNIYGPCEWLVFLPNKINTNTNLNKKDPEYGYLYAAKDSDSTEVGIRNYWHSLRAGPAVSGDTQEALYRPFGRNATGGTYITLIYPTGGSDLCSVYHYAPFAWYGRVCQVIAAVLISKGIEAGYLDTTAFSASDDAQAAMGTSDDEEPYVFYRRQIGQSIGDAIKEICLCCWDILTVNMDGQVALMPRTGVPAGFTVSGLDRTDGVISVQRRLAYDMLVNHTWASEGRYFDISFETVSTFTSCVATCVEMAYPRVADDKRGLPFAEYEDATSQTKYGLRELGRETDIQEGNEVKTIRQHHFQHLCNIQNSASGDPLEAKTQLMTRLEDVESVLRREVTIVQDLRGLDYDVGYLIEDLAVTGDGDTFDAFCIRKTINFDDLSVTSVLLEEPS